MIDCDVGKPNVETMDALNKIGDGVRSYAGDLVLQLLEPPSAGESVPKALGSYRMGTDPGV